MSTADYTLGVRRIQVVHKISFRNTLIWIKAFLRQEGSKGLITKVYEIRMNYDHDRDNYFNF